MQIRRLIAVTAAALACAAPAASAMPIDNVSPAQSPPKAETGYTATAVHNDAVDPRTWETARSAPATPLADHTGGHSYFPAIALVSGLILLSLLLTQLLGKSVIRSRRGTRVA